MTDSLTGRVVIVTGASSGIGEATARLLHEAGAHPVLAARWTDRLEVLSKELGGALAVPTDVTDPSQVHALVHATIDRHGRVDGLVNNAGAAYHRRIEEIDPAAYLKLLNLNVGSWPTTTSRSRSCCRRSPRPSSATACSSTARWSGRAG